MLLSWEPQRRIFSVSELNSAVQRLFEAEFSNIWVAGEISGCRTHTSGHFYFSLKDEQSQLKCVLFKGTHDSLSSGRKMAWPCSLVAGWKFTNYAANIS